MHYNKLMVLSVALLLSACARVVPSCSVVCDGPFDGFKKIVINDLIIVPQTQCLSFDVVNFKGETLIVSNQCSEIFSIGGFKVPANKANGIRLTLVDENVGPSSSSKVKSGCNSIAYKAEADRKVSLKGMLGSKEINISFTKNEVPCR